MRRPLAALLPLALAAACGGAARETRPTTPVQQPQPVAQVEPPKPPEPPKPVVEEGLVIDYRSQVEGKTLIEVAQPEGSQVDVYEGARQIGHDTAPMAVRAGADEWYRVHVRLPSGLEREKKVQALHGLVTSLRFVDVAPQGPVAISRAEFGHLVDALDREPGDAAKLSVLKTASASAYFTTAMVGVILDHIVYRQSKLDAVPILKDRIVDRQNAYTLYQHFTYREDKAKVQQILEK